MKRRSMSLFLFPMALWTVIFVFLPLVYIVVLSFFKGDAYKGVVYQLTLENYAGLFTSTLLSILRRSLSLALKTALCCLAIALPFSYFVARLRGRTRNLVFFLVALPFWTNSLIRTHGIMSLLQANGPINSVLMGLGLIKSPVQFLYNEHAVLLGMVYSLLPFMILPVYAALERMDVSLAEASRDLGAGRLRTLWSVTLPGALPGILSGFVLVFIPSVGMFFISDLMGGGKIMLLGNLIQLQATTGHDRPFAAALSVLMMAMASVFILIYRRVSGEKEPIGMV